jgi:ribose transport system permease protein
VRDILRRIAGAQQLGLIAMILLLLVIAQSANSQALTSANIIEILRSSALYFIGASVATLVVVGGGLDLSIGSVFAVGGVSAGIAMNDGVPWPLAILLALAICAVLGFINAALVTWVGVPPFITTLGMLFAASGLVIVVTRGIPRFGFPTAFNDLGQLNLFGIPLLVYYAVIIGVIAHIVLQHSVFGYDIRAFGGSPTAARANGIRPARMNISLYVISAVVAGLCGILLAARVATADPGAGGTGFAFQVLAAVIIGGTSLFGGVGSIPGTALGALLFAVINNTLALTNTNPQWQNVATGVILVAAVAVDQLRRQRRFAKKTA